MAPLHSGLFLEYYPQVLVPPAGQVDYDDLMGRSPTGLLHGMSQGMRTFQSRENTLEGTKFSKGRQGFIVGNGDISGPSHILEKGVFGTDAWSESSAT
jgi:hypothetical protein